MKKITSIKTRITIWYTSLMLVLIFVVLSLVGGLSYQLSIDSVEKDVILQVTQVTEKLSKMQRDVFDLVDSKEEFKNISIYESNGKYIVGQYIYDVVNIPFEEGIPRRGSVDGKDYIVYDNGMGIPDEHIDKIWTRFYRIDNVRNDEYGSSGLGLAMVKSIIEFHGGTITVKSSADTGSEFTIIL